MLNPLISIIVPVYDVEKYLDRCLQSIVAQTYKNIEIILVDDGSPDNCPAMCDEWAEKDSRIRVIHKENGGLAHARNTGIENASGSYFLFVDSDDYMDSDMVEFLYSLICKYDADIARCGFYYNYENGEEIADYSATAVKLLDYDDRMIDLFVGGHISGVAWNKLYKREVIANKPYKKEDGCSEDILHNYRVYKDNPKTVFCDIPKYHYFVREASITNNKFSLGAFDIIRAKTIMLDGERDNPKIYPYAIKGYIMSAFVVLSGCIRNNAFPKRAEKLKKSIVDHRKEILASGLYTGLDKLKTVLICISPKLYDILIKWKG